MTDDTQLQVMQTGHVDLNVSDLTQGWPQQKEPNYSLPLTFNETYDCLILTPSFL